VTTLALTQTHNLQSITWAGAGALGALLRTLAVALLAGVLLTGCCAAAVIVTAMIPPTFWAGLVIIAGYAVATYPRSKAVNHAR